MRYVNTSHRFGGGYYYILCCATVNDDKLDQASGIWSWPKTGVSSRVSIICCDHVPFSPNETLLPDEILFYQMKFGSFTSPPKFSNGGHFTAPLLISILHSK